MKKKNMKKKKTKWIAGMLTCVLLGSMVLSVAQVCAEATSADASGETKPAPAASAGGSVAAELLSGWSPDRYTAYIRRYEDQVRPADTVTRAARPSRSRCARARSG